MNFFINSIYILKGNIINLNKLCFSNCFGNHGSSYGIQTNFFPTNEVFFNYSIELNVGLKDREILFSHLSFIGENNILFFIIIILLIVRVNQEE